MFCVQQPQATPALQMQQPNQQPATGLLSSTLSRLEQAARSAAPGLTQLAGQQVDRLCGALGIGTTTTTNTSSSYYPQAAAMPPYPVPYPTLQQAAPCWPSPGPQGPYPQPYSPYQQQQQQQGPYPQPCSSYHHQHQQQQQQQHTPPVTQVYPLQHQPPAYPHAAPWQQHHHPQPWQQQAPHHHQQQEQHQQQQREAEQEIPILEATVTIKPSGLPVGSRPADAAAAAAAAAAIATSAPQQQVAVPLQQLLEQLWASRVPAAAQGPAAAAVVGSWYHTLSEVTFMPDGRCYWSRSSASNAADHKPAAAAAAAADGAAAADSSSTRGGGSQSVEVWHGVWRVQAGSSAGAGKIDLVYIVEQQQQQQQQQRWQRVVAYQTSALDDALVLDGLAHIKLGA